MVSEHVVLPILHLLLDAVRPEEPRASSRRQKWGGTPQSAAITSVQAAGGGTPAAAGPDPGPGTAGGTGSMSSVSAGGALPPGAAPSAQGSSDAVAKGGRTSRGGGANNQRQGTAGAPVNFNEFLSGRTGLTEYLARRTAIDAATGMPDRSRALALG